MHFLIFFFLNSFHFSGKVPAHFKNSFSAETIRKGDNVRIVCEAFGEDPVTINWTKDRIPFQPTKEPRYSLIEQTGGQQQLSSNSRSLLLSTNIATIDDQPVYKEQSTSKDDQLTSTSIRLNSLNRLNALQNLKHTHSFINILEINRTDRRDSALFSCIASNLYGKDEFNVQIIVQGKLVVYLDIENLLILLN